MGCGASAPRPMQLRRVILYQNGIGYFERTGQIAGGTLRLSFATPELDDVLKTLTVIDRLGAGVATVDVPVAGDKDKTIAIDVRLAAGRVHDLLVGYAVPTPTWKAAYRLVLDDPKASALLQGWAVVNNSSQEDWRGVQLTLATGAPMSFAHDLHTPEYVQRPDVTGRLISPTVLGPIATETTGATDRDADGILDVDDVCPATREDLDGFEDLDGCAELDNDRDQIVDVDDKCPSERESQNGVDDDDGCPDRGRVVTTDSAIVILENIAFARSSAVIATATSPILDAIAATMRENPDIALVEIGGHAAADEAEPWGLSSQRAESVRTALVARGVAPSRLEVTPYAATNPLRATGPTAAANNRRVELLILKRTSDVARESPSYVARQRSPQRLDTASMQASVHARTTPATVAGTVRYALTEPVSIRRGASSMVSILNKAVRGEDALLFRPDGNAPGSDRHPFRVARLENSSGYTLEPGPIAIFSGGTFVGDSLLSRLQIGETTWIPYALDGGTTVTSSGTNEEHPVRLVAMHRGVMTVENAAVRTTTYTIAPGHAPTRTLYLRHARAAGYTAKDLPPNTIDQPDAYLLPVPLHAARTSTLTVEERQPRRASIALLDAGRTELGVYLEGGTLPAELGERVKAAIALRKEMGTIEDELAALRSRVSEISSRAYELRGSIKALDRVRGADDLRNKLVASLTQTTAESDTIARTLGMRTEALAAVRSRLQVSLAELTLTEAGH